MTELIVVRHGETAWNAEKRLQGHIDIGLNAEGRRQAEAVARTLSDAGIEAVVASDLSRAQATAAAVARFTGHEVESDVTLRERCYGAFEGLKYDEIRERFPQGWLDWQARDPHARFPDGERRAETLHEFAQRVQTALAGVAERHVGKRVLVVSHGGLLDCAYRLATRMSLEAPRNFDVRNASINRFRWNGALELLAWGDVAHLAASMDELPNV